MTLSEYVELLGHDDRQKLESFLKTLGLDLSELSSIEEFKRSSWKAGVFTGLFLPILLRLYVNFRSRFIVL